MSDVNTYKQKEVMKMTNAYDEYMHSNISRNLLYQRLEGEK